MIRTLSAALAVMLMATGASAEVVSRTADGFVLRYEVAVETTPDDAWVAVGEVGRWWNGAHTYSGTATNMTLPLQVGGCLCEALADGTIFEHGRVTRADPQAGVAIDAPLGPLKGKATRADLDLTWANEGRGLKLAMTFTVEGPGLGAFAGPVDGVMGDQFARWVHYVETGETP